MPANPSRALLLSKQSSNRIKQEALRLLSRDDAEILPGSLCLSFCIISLHLDDNLPIYEQLALALERLKMLHSQEQQLIEENSKLKDELAV